MSQEDRERKLQSILHAYLQALSRGEPPNRQALLNAHPELRDELNAYFAGTSNLGALAKLQQTVSFGSDSMVSPSVPSVEKVRSIGKYELLEEIGRGGMGVVYKAKQPSLNRLVALKTMRSGVHASEQELARFRTEAEMIARLQHPNFVQIFEIGVADDCLFLALEYVAGGTLGQRLNGVPWPAKRAARLIETLAAALEHAHAKNIVHRDLKPANILMQSKSPPTAVDTTAGRTSQGEFVSASTIQFVPESADAATLTARKQHRTQGDGETWDEEVPKISDFGLAKDIANEHGQTVTGAFMGTPSYAAPEQALGNSRHVTARTDVYALGAILYELLTGRPPFRGTNVLETLEQVRVREPVAPALLNPGVPRDLETICLKCLHKQQTQRYPSAAELANDLGRFLRNEPIKARPASLYERCWRWCQRNKVGAAFIAVLSVGSLALLGLIWLSQYHAGIAKTNAGQANQNAELYKEMATKEQSARVFAEEETKRANQNFAQAEQNATQEKIARVFAEGETKRADAELSNAREALYTAQLLRVSSLWEQEPAKARELLHDTELCPLERRDHAWHLLDRACNFEAASFELGSRYKDVVVCPDGETVWLTNDSNDIRRLSWRKGTDLPALTEHKTKLVRLLTMADSVLSLSEEGTLHFWEPAQGTIRKSLQLDEGTTQLALSPEGKLLAGAKGKQIKLYDLDTGETMRTIEANNNVQSLAFRPDGKALAAATMVHLFVWDLEAPKPDGIASAVAGVSADLAILFGPDGKSVFTSGYAGVREWDAVTLEPRTTPLGRFNGHLKFSRTGSTLLTTSQNVLNVLDMPTGTLRYALDGQAGALTTVLFTPDEKQAVTLANRGQHLRVWNLASPVDLGLPSEPDWQTLFLGIPNDRSFVALLQRHARLQKSQLSIWDVAQSRWRSRTEIANVAKPHLSLAPDGHCVVYCGQGRAHFIDPATGKPLLRQVPDLPERIERCTFSADGQWFLASGQEIKLYSTKSWQSTGVLQGVRGFQHYAFSPDGKILAAISSIGALWVFDRHTGEKLESTQDGAFQSQMLLFAPDGRTLVQSDLEVPKFRLVPGLKELQLLPKRAEESRNQTSAGAACFAPDDRTFIYHNGDRAERAQILLVDLKTKQQRGVLTGYAPPSFSGDRHSFVAESVNRQGRLQLWTTAPLPQAPLIDMRVPMGRLDTFAIGTKLIVGGCYVPGGSVCWEATTFKQRHVLPLRAVRVSVSKDDRTLVNVEGALATLWDLNTGTLRAVVPQGRPVLAFDLSPDSREFVTITDAQLLRTWDCATGKLLTTTNLEFKSAATLCYADTESVWLAGQDSVYLWDLKSQQVRHTLAKVGSVTQLKLSPDGKVLAIGLATGLIKLWDTVAQQPGGELDAHTTGISAFAFSPDSKTLASGAGDHAVHLWDSEKGRKLRSYHAHDRVISGLAFDPQGSTLFTGTKHGFITGWRFARQ